MARAARDQRTGSSVFHPIQAPSCERRACQRPPGLCQQLAPGSGAADGCREQGTGLTAGGGRQAYEHAYDLAASFGELSMNVEVLVQARARP